MKRGRIVGVALAGALAAAGTASAHALRAAESITVSNTSSTAVSSSLVLDAKKRYRIVASGTISDWCTATSCPAGNADQAAQPNVGVDPMYCYAKWRCPTPELWRQLQVNGKGLDQLAGQEGKIAYSGGHSYTVEFTGVSGKLSFVAADALGSAGDNSGSFTVQLTEVGGGSSGGSRPAARLSPEAVKKAVRALPQYRAFYGLDDPVADNWAEATQIRCDQLVQAVGTYPGVHSAGHIPGETADGVHSSELWWPGNDLFNLLSRSERPSELFKDNVYARATPFYEKQLREQILSSSGDLDPEHVMQMALKATGGNYGLAVLTAHNLLKNVTMTGRETIGELADPNAWNIPAKRQALLDQLDQQSAVAGKLGNLRADPRAAADKMGPWYHIFAVLTAGALESPGASPSVMAAEHTAKFLKQFGSEGGFNREKATIDACFAKAALTKSVVGVSRWIGSRNHD